MAANSELRMMPPARRGEAVSLPVSMRVLSSLFLRSTTRRRKLPSSSGAQRTVSCDSWWSGVVSAVTRRPARPSTCWRTWSLPRMKAAAAGSATPRRWSRVSAVSLPRVYSERYRDMPCTLSVSSARVWPSASDSTGVESMRTGRSAGSGPRLATAKAPPPPVSKMAASAAVTRLGCCWITEVSRATKAPLAWFKPYFTTSDPWVARIRPCEGRTASQRRDTLSRRATSPRSAVRIGGRLEFAAAGKSPEYTDAVLRGLAKNPYESICCYNIPGHRRCKPSA